MSLESSTHLSGMVLDSLLMGALSQEDEKRARVHLEQCPACSQRLAEAHTSTEKFQHQVEQRSLERLRARMQQAPVEARPWKRYALAAAVALALVGAGAALLALAA